MEVLRWFDNDGFFMVSSHPVKKCTYPYIVEEVGRTPLHTAYLLHPNSLKNAETKSQQTTEDIIRLKNECRQLKEQLTDTQHTLDNISNSIIWRASKPIRKLLDALRPSK